jgi:hypothetical protein
LNNKFKGDKNMSFIQRIAQMRTPVSTYANLPIVGNTKGDLRIATDTGLIYMWKLDSETNLITDSYTKLLLHLDNDVIDSETTPKEVTNNDVTFSTDSEFGTYSGIFNGTSSYLSVLSNSDFDFGTGDFTLDLCANINSLVGDSRVLISRGYESNFVCFMFRVESLTQLTFSYSIDGIEFSKFLTVPMSISLNQWNHYAAVRNGTTLTLYVNGVSCGTMNMGTDSIYSSSTQLLIGARNAGFDTTFVQHFNGKIDEVRISKGIARWTSNFVPPGVGSLTNWKKVVSSDYNDLSGTPYSTALDIDNAANIVTDLSINIAILAWQTLTSFSASVVKMFDGVVNQFTDESGIELAECYNQIYTDDLFYQPITSTNMTLQSIGYVTNYNPTSARIVILEEDIDVILDTDLLVYISRDGGTNFTSVTITKDSSYGDGSLNIFTGSADISAPPLGQLMVWKLVTQNHKDCKIRGVSLNWK